LKKNESVGLTFSRDPRKISNTLVNLFIRNYPWLLPVFVYLFTFCAKIFSKIR